MSDRTLDAIRRAEEVLKATITTASGGKKLPRQGKLRSDEEKLEAKPPFATVNPGSEKTDGLIPLGEVLPHFEKPILLRAPAVTLVGSVPNNGRGADLDFLVEGPLDDATRQVIEFRLGRALPPELSKRCQFHDESLGGPFTSHVALYDLALVPRAERKVIEMREVEKQDDPLQEYPSTPNTEVKGVAQLHFRGKTAHVDLRFRVGGDYLVGWTVAVQKPGSVPEVTALEQARAVARQFDSTGSVWNKPIVTPGKVYAVPKSRQPVAWFDLKDQVIEPGSVGATSFEPGVFVVLDRFVVEWGLQKASFHEYFISGSTYLDGVLYFRRLVGSDAEGENRTPEGERFWSAWISKDLLPSVLKTRTVREGDMPPDGYSAMPRSLMEQTPGEFRFWQERGAKAREMRDALVKARLFTPENLALVNGEIRRVEKRASGGVGQAWLLAPGADGGLEVFTVPRSSVSGLAPASPLTKRRSYEEESALIRENRKTPAAQAKHKFKAAEWTHPNGHPRCLLCGGEETISGWCNDRAGDEEALREAEADEARKFERKVVKILPVTKAADQRIVFGIVLEPDEVDSQGDTETAETITAAAHEWLARFQNRGLMHREIVNDEVEIYESYVAPVDMTIEGQKVKRGTWLLMLHVKDDKIWDQIKRGALTGYSMGGFARRVHLQAD